jgi:carbonic anhydrase
MRIQTNRRDLLKFAAGATALASAPLRSFAQSADPLFKKPASPDEAVRLLMEGNARFVAGKMESFQADLSVLREHSEPHQEPFAAILACADSRVPPELVFDQSLGHLFVVRVAGNIAAPDTIASLEYGGAVLGVKTLLVVGHTQCGAVKAAIERKAVPGQISSLYQYIRPAVEHSSDATEVARRNALLQARMLRESSPVIADLVKDNKMSVKAALYDVGSGKVGLLGD